MLPILTQSPTAPRAIVGAPPLTSPITVVEYLCAGGAVCNTTPGSTSASVTFGTATTAGELIFAATSGSTTGTAYGSVTDSASQTYTQDANIRRTGIGAHQAATVWYFCGSASGVTSFTWTYGSGDGSTSRMIVAHVKGIAASSCRDTSANFPASASNTPFSSTSITPASGHAEWIVGPVISAFGTNTTISATSPWTLEKGTASQPANDNLFLFDQIVPSTSGSYSVAGTGTSGTAIYFPSIIAFTH